MQLLINGAPTSLPEAATVSDLIARLELQGRIAVEINRQIVPRSAFDQRQLTEGDEVEIVAAVGGG